MTGKGEYYVRCKNCGKLIRVFNAPSQGYCTKCETLFDYDTQDVVFSGITTIPSDYHYEFKEENIEQELAKYKKAFEILKGLVIFDKENQAVANGTSIIDLSNEEAELLEALFNKDNVS